MRGKIEQHQAENEEVARARQRAHQAKYRKKLKKRRAPNRDDLAALALRFVIRLSLSNWERNAGAWLRFVKDTIDTRRFEFDEAERVFRSIAKAEAHRSRIEKPEGASNA
ncbi:hypothetical protein [Bosea beijingensis]